MEAVVDRDSQTPAVCEMVPERLGKSYGTDIVDVLVLESVVGERLIIYPPKHDRRVASTS